MIGKPGRSQSASAIAQSLHRRELAIHGNAFWPIINATSARSAANPRYTWLDDVSRAVVQNVLRRSHAMVLSSRSEGGANVISEAIVRSQIAASTSDAKDAASSSTRRRKGAGMTEDIAVNCKLGQHVFVLQSARLAEVAEWQTQRIQNPPSERA